MDNPGGASLDDLATAVRTSAAGTRDTSNALLAWRLQIEQHAALLESPQAALEFADFFIDFLGRAASDLDRLAEELPDGVLLDHSATLRQIASNGSVEQRRCLMFRDKWVNKPLPHEQMRAVLDGMSAGARDRLSGYTDLNVVAARLDEMTASDPRRSPAGSESSEGRMGRRELFNRLFRRP